MGENAAGSAELFSSFISAPFAPFGFGFIFLIACAAIIVLGVKNGIEKSNLILMPILFFMAIALSIYIICLPGSSAGLKYYLIPNISSLSIDGSFSIQLLGKTILGAMGQMFYSLSLAMGIMITYGSYMRKEDSIEKSVRRIEIFDTLIAIIAGLMIIPVVYMFAVKSGMDVKEAMNAGPGLMFITLPKVFATLGTSGAWVGLAFFLLVTFAAATSAISLFEACVASVCDLLKIERRSATFFMGSVICFLATFSALGYGPWKDVTLSSAFHAIGVNAEWTNGAFFKLQGLDFFDFITNSVLMPIVAVITCIFIGWVMGPKTVIEEVSADGHEFKSKGFYSFMVKYIAPLLILAVLVSEVCRAFKIGGWSI